MTLWHTPTPLAVPDALRQAVSGHPLIAETLTQRGILTPAEARAFLDPAEYSPASPFDLPDMDRAVERIRRAIRTGEKIAVWGDFDVDGQTSTALLVSSLRDLDGRVTYHIPNRRDEGHGVNVPNLRRLIDGGAQLIITCDTGIAAHEAVDYANERGVDVIITDHHNLPDELPNALAAINPKRLPDHHPLRDLPGVGVAYKLIEALNGDSPGGDLPHLLDLVALGIVADVAPQTRDTRYLLQHGLTALRETQRLGVLAMIDLAQVDPSRLTEEHIAFALAPRLNALGRLEDANIAVELLTTRDLERARVLANRLEALNTQRQLLVEQVYGAAQAQLDADRSLLDASVIVLAHPQWHAGVVGIVANRLVEQYRRPVILLVAPEGEAAHGSARSVDGVDITAALAANANLLIQYGGHAMAAGLRVAPENLNALRRGLSRVVALPSSEPTLDIHGFVTLPEITLNLAAQLERLAPFGAGNPPLVLAARDVRVTSTSAVGRSGDHARLTVEDAHGNKQRLIWWRSGVIPQGRIDVAFSARAVDYKGERQLQVEWIDSRPAEGVVQLRDPSVEIVDYRADPNPVARLRAIDDAAVWREVDPQVEGATRLEIAPASHLAIWTIPPGGEELRAVLEWVKPECVTLFASDPGMDLLEPFVKRLAALVKYAITNRGGVLTLASLAAATAQREITVRAGLDWLAARGQIAFMNGDDGTILAATVSTGRATAALDAATDRLTALLRESAAYRAFYRRATTASLLASN